MLAILKMIFINWNNNFNGIVEERNHVIELQKNIIFC